MLAQVQDLAQKARDQGWRSSRLQQRLAATYRAVCDFSSAIEAYQAALDEGNVSLESIEHMANLMAREALGASGSSYAAAQASDGRDPLAQLERARCWLDWLLTIPADADRFLRRAEHLRLKGALEKRAALLAGPGPAGALRIELAMQQYREAAAHEERLNPGTVDTYSRLNVVALHVVRGWTGPERKSLEAELNAIGAALQQQERRRENEPWCRIGQADVALYRAMLEGALSGDAQEDRGKCLEALVEGFIGLEFLSHSDWSSIVEQVENMRALFDVQPRSPAAKKKNEEIERLRAALATLADRIRARTAPP